MPTPLNVRINIKNDRSIEFNKEDFVFFKSFIKVVIVQNKHISFFLNGTDNKK